MSYLEMSQKTGRNRQDLKRWNDLYEKYPNRENYKKLAEEQAESWTKKAFEYRLSLPAAPALPQEVAGVIYADSGYRGFYCS